MMRLLMRKLVRRDREGSTLVSVVIGVLFLAAIGLIVFTAANQYMVSVSVDHNSSNNFYEAEGILEEVKTGLLEYAGDASEEAYRYMLEHYSQDKDSKREVFSKKYFTLLATKLQSSDGTFEWKDEKLGKAQAGDIQKLKALSKVPQAVTLKEGTELAFVIKKDETTGEYSMVIRNLLINYEDDSGYRSSIQTDICLSIPDYSLEGNSSFDEMKNYISISDDTLKVEDYRINNSIHGNIYSGNEKQGLLLGQGCGVDFKSSTIVSRGDLEVHNGAKATLAGETGVGDLYLKNIHLTPGGSTDSTLNTSLSLKANAYIANDLNIETNNSTVTLGGKYYGYSYNEDNDANSSSTVNSDYSSAILINGQNTTLKSDNLKSLVLAGRAFVSREKKKDGTKPVTDIMMGESIAVKSNQLAYLVPDEYIVSDLGNPDDYHNPVFKQELEEAKVHVDVEGLKDNFKDESGNSYLADTPYEANYNNTIGYVFFYLKFKDEASANRYFEKYYNAQDVDEDGNVVNHEDELKRKGKVYISKEDLGIKIDETLYLVAGNVMNNYYGTSGTGLQTATYFGTNQKPNSDLLNEGVRMGQNYVGFQLGLTPAKNTTGAMRLPEKDSDGNIVPTKPLVASSIVDFNNAKFNEQVTDPVTVKKQEDTGVDGATLCISKGDYTLDSKMKGLLVVNGDVTVKSDFTGLILATGKVRIENNNLQLKSDMVVVGKLFDYIRTDKKLISLFRGLNGTLENRSSSAIECISYQNWIKNNY